LEETALDAGQLKGLEVILIAGAVAWFYFSQINSLKKLKKEREEKDKKKQEGGGDSSRKSPGG
jgi:hypothetical protein